ncbi:hypothetical protein BD770DRAFT_389166 [Pilaira anomala]|nr:hypothetical protein BD770DRAFT_389166 [Pilaira anomala]
MKFIILTCIILCCFNTITSGFPIYPQTFDLGDRIMFIIPKHHHQQQHTESCFQDISEEEEVFEEFMTSFYDDDGQLDDDSMFGWSRLFKDVYSYLIGFLDTRNHQFYI